MKTNHIQWYSSKAKELLSNDEINDLLKKSNWKAGLEVFDTWLWISIAFLLAGLWSNPLTIIIALFILGGKQLGCAILMHDASHNSLFVSKKENRFFGNWLGGYPIFHDVDRYRPYHYKHHVTTGTDEDPDLSLIKGYPTSVISFCRKITRDLIGATGIKAYIGVFAMHLGYIKYSLGGLITKLDQTDRGFINVARTTIMNLYGPLLANAFILSVLWLSGAAWLYLLWIGALLTTFNFCLRIRSIAEHSIVPTQEDPHRNTRTIYANWIERMLFAPHHVNYHTEHHLMMQVPSYNLPKMHKIIKNQGYFKSGLLEKNYWEIIKLAVRKKLLY